MESILVSACLLGVNCKYSGGNNLTPQVVKLKGHFHLIPICPEGMGGLPTPRPPAERRGDAVINQQGEDVTAQYERGAAEAVKLAKCFSCRAAILKSGSPSCGYGEIYDGTFSGVKVPGNGVAAQRLREEGLMILTEKEISARSDEGIFVFPLDTRKTP